MGRITPYFRLCKTDCWENAHFVFKNYIHWTLIHVACTNAQPESAFFMKKMKIKCLIFRTNGSMLHFRRGAINAWSVPFMNGFNPVLLKCIWHEFFYFLKWKNSLSCSVTYFSVSCFYGLFPRYFNLFGM
jgi:tRNA(His) 5'-end guanylyltransferase